ncbi:unnamed protein product [Orchesella dallaii]|uniref:Uncharacterized protein n=1 Tax=Orchesella dallaii TaxID=48710 RepID=A0ABP1RE61_9HEXA
MGSADMDSNFFILPHNQKKLPPSFYRFCQVDNVQEELEPVQAQLTPPEKMEKVKGKSKRPRGSPIPEEVAEIDESITGIVSTYKKYWEKEVLI